MAKQTEHGITYVDETWNPIRGCDPNMPCAPNCWARRMALRHEGVASLPHLHGFVDRKTGNWTGRVSLIESELRKPLNWVKARCVATCFMGDLFLAPSEVIDRVVAMMTACPQHKFVVLTKQAKLMYKYFDKPSVYRERIFHALHDQRTFPGDWRRAFFGQPSRVGIAEGILKGWRDATHNIRLGISARNQGEIAARAPWLQRMASAGWRTWLSLEPLLGPVDVRPYVDYCVHCDKHGIIRYADGRHAGCDRYPGLDHVIVGGESGPGARPCYIRDIESIIEQCQISRVPCFVKQLGSYPIWAGAKAAPISPSIGKNNNPELWPESLRVQEFPNANR